MRSLPILLAVLATSAWLHAQAPEVPIIQEGHGPAPEILEAANTLREAGGLLHMDKVKEQLARASCELTLAPASDKKLSGRDLWSRARGAHIRIGYLYLCKHCDKWHLNVAGGYALTADGAVATCYHVAEPKDMREGYLIAVTDAGVALPVTEVLAASKFTDTCIVRVKLDAPVEPLSLNPLAHPGDDAWCYSDPLGHPGFFSKGIVNRFYEHTHGKGSKDRFPKRMNVSTEWAPGSSGAAVIDECGNAIGHVSEISAHGEKNGQTTGKNASGETLIVFHNAVRAADVLALIKAPKK
jgi:Trypsin-like peptidase domain